MIELILYSVLYSYVVFVPLFGLYTVFMILTERWKVIKKQNNHDELESFINSSFYFNEQAD